MHHIFKPPDFRPVEENLRECFRVLAAQRARGEVLELPGVTIASAGVSFQMFNAAFLSAPVTDAEELDARVMAARKYFASQGMRWSFWFCEDWAQHGARRKAGAVFQRHGLNLTSEMPGMVAAALKPGERASGLHLRLAAAGESLALFRQIGALCFHVPPVWFGEVFDDAMMQRPGFRASVAYEDDTPIGTAASVITGRVVGLYNIAVLPEYRRRGYGSMITRLAAEDALDGDDAPRGNVAPRAERSGGFILQASSQGIRMYERMGFRSVTRLLVYNST